MANFFLRFDFSNKYSQFSRLSQIAIRNFRNFRNLWNCGFRNFANNTIGFWAHFTTLDEMLVTKPSVTYRRQLTFELELRNFDFTFGYFFSLYGNRNLHILSPGRRFNVQSCIYGYRSSWVFAICPIDHSRFTLLCVRPISPSLENNFVL